MKNLEKLSGNCFANFKENEVSNIAAILGGAEGNTRGGFDWRDKCTKRKCDKATSTCEDTSSSMAPGGDLGHSSHEATEMP